ncbi:MAG: hypothetical protein Ct9H300mP1_24800 [Planctomycetaceae bacterium]|nr:MAG: hypothetical protein Ct9H300mP1_24800 [Planctomycetaceae bacterium]
MTRQGVVGIPTAARPGCQVTGTRNSVPTPLTTPDQMTAGARGPASRVFPRRVGPADSKPTRCRPPSGNPSARQQPPAGSGRGAAGTGSPGRLISQGQDPEHQTSPTMPTTSVKTAAELIRWPAGHPGLDPRLQEDHRADDTWASANRPGCRRRGPGCWRSRVDRRNDDDQETDGDPADQPPPGGAGEPGGPTGTSTGQGIFEGSLAKTRATSSCPR